ncbi:MAG: carboxypeptidase regulatory-like domain-containing protein [Terracidiphilus sp.]
MKQTALRQSASWGAQRAPLAWKWLALLAIAFIAPLAANAQLTGTGAISGTVTDPSGAIVPNATVTVTNVATTVKTVSTTTGAGDYNISPLPPGEYTVTVSAKGFKSYLQEHVAVNAIQTVTVNVKLSLGAAEETVTVSAAPPVLDMADAQVGGVMDNKMYSNLPLLMGASGQPDQRRATDFSYLMPGVQNTLEASSSGNPTDASGAVNGGSPSGGTSEVYIDGVDLPEGDGVGDPRYTWTSISVDAVDQFQIESAGYSAQYAGQGVQNYSVKSGTNQYHGTVYEYFRNTALDAWQGNAKIPTATGAPIPPGGSCSSAKLSASNSWCALGGVKPAEHMNENGIDIGGPIVKNKLFLFYNYDEYRDAAGPSPHAQSIPTLAELGYSSSGSAQGYADFSGYATAYGKSGCVIGSTTNPCYDIYDPASQTVYDCQGAACQRTIFPNDQIPASRFSAASAYINKFMVPYAATANQSSYSNNITVGYPSGLSNWSQTGRLDYDMNPSNQVSLIVAFGRQSVWGGYDIASGASNALPPPFNNKQFYAPTTTVDMLKDTWTINPHLVNQAALAFGRYQSIDSDQDDKSIYDAASTGLLNTPPGQPTAGFPGIDFSGGGASPQNEAGYNWHGQLQNTYVAMDNMEWQHGRHNVTFGGQYVDVQFTEWDTGGSTPLTYTFEANQTQGYQSGPAYPGGTGAGIPDTGNSFASYMLGAVEGSSISLSPEWSLRWPSPSLWVEDAYKVTSKLTLNLGVRWDLFGTAHEVHNQWSWLSPNTVNFNTGNYGTLALAGGTNGDGAYSGEASPSHMWYRNVGPRLGLAYALDPKTVIHASYAVSFAHGNWTGQSASQHIMSQNGLTPSASAPGGLSNAPSFYWDGTACSAAAGGATSTGVNPVAAAGTAVAADGFTPCGWTGSTTTPAGVIAQEVAAGNMPVGATLAEYGTSETAGEKNTNSITAAYFDPYLGSRTPEYINWTFGFQRALTNNMSVSVDYVGSEGHFISVSGANYLRNNGLPQSDIGLAGYAVPTPGATTAAACSGASCVYPILNQKATTTDLALAQGFGFTPPNPYTNPANFYSGASVEQYYTAFPQYKSVSDQTSFVGNEDWNALEVSVKERPTNGLNFMVNYTWSKSMDDLGTFRISGDNHLDRSRSAADQPQNLVVTAVYQLPLGRGHMWGDNPVYRSIASGWLLSGIGTDHSGLPMLITGSGCAGSGILGTCMPSVVAGQTGRQYKWGKTAGGQAVSWDPNNANYIGKVDYVNPAAFTVINGGTCSTKPASAGAYHTSTGQAYYVCNGPEDYVPGTAARTDPIKGLFTQPYYDVDAALKRSFPIYHEWTMQFELDMTNVTNHVVYAGPGSLSVSSTSDSTGSFATVSKIANYPRDVQAAVRISF